MRNTITLTVTKSTDNPDVNKLWYIMEYVALKKAMRNGETALANYLASKVNDGMESILSSQLILENLSCE